jgi:hypothetical protein
MTVAWRVLHVDGFFGRWFSPLERALLVMRWNLQNAIWPARKQVSGE